MTLSVEQITDFRSDIADTSNAFTDAEIQRLYTRAGTYEGAVLLAIDQLIADASRLYSYRMNTTQENLDEIVEHLKIHVRPIWAERAANAEKKQTPRRIRLCGTGNPQRKKPQGWS